MTSRFSVLQVAQFLNSLLAFLHSQTSSLTKTIFFVVVWQDNDFIDFIFDMKISVPKQSI